MKTILTVLITSLVLLLAGAATLLTWQHNNNKSLANLNAGLTQELNGSRAEVSLVTREKEQLAEQLATLETRERQLRERVDVLETAAKSVADVAPRPYRVRAFVGKENVGDAWIVPHNVTRDKESGRYTFEPVLWIEESAKDHFTVYQTNVVEQEVYTTEVVQDTYGYPYYYYVTPRRPGKPGRPPYNPNRPTQPQPAQPQPATQANASARLFGPPFSIINSRPQVLGTPATSPTAAALFAPP